MTSPAVVVDPSATVGEAARLMERHGVKRLPVVDAQGRLRGIVSRWDLVRVFTRPDEHIRAQICEEVIRHDLWIAPGTVTVHVTDGVVDLTGELDNKTLARVLVRMCHGVDGVIKVRDHLTWAVDDTRIRGPFEGAPYGPVP
jgi:CBS domain-containing protein